MEKSSTKIAVKGNVGRWRRIGKVKESVIAGKRKSDKGRNVVERLIPHLEAALTKGALYNRGRTRWGGGKFSSFLSDRWKNFKTLKNLGIF